MKNKPLPKPDGVIPWCSTVYESQTIDASDIEHWNGEEYLYKKYKSHVVCSNGLEYRFYLDDMNSDGLSVYGPPQSKIERFGWYLAGGLDHDGLFAGEIFPQWLCDYIFREKNQYKDTFRKTWCSRIRGSFLRNAAYYAVRSFGWIVWKKHDPEKVKPFREGVWIEIIACPEKLFNEILKWENSQIEKGIGEVIKEMNAIRL